MTTTKGYPKEIRTGYCIPKNTGPFEFEVLDFGIQVLYFVDDGESLIQLSKEKFIEMFEEINKEDDNSQEYKKNNG